MPEMTLASIGSLVKGVTQVLHLKSRQRDGFFQKVILKAYQSFEATLREHHTSLAPYVSRLEELASRLERSDNQTSDVLEQILQDLRALETGRIHGQLDRRALYETCLRYERSGYAFGGPVPSLSVDEKATLRTFMHRICSYFVTNDKYQHVYANLLGTISWLEKWQRENQLNPAEIREVKAAFEQGLSEMRTLWGDVSVAFHELELALQHDFHFRLPVGGGSPRTAPLCFRDAA